MLISIKDVGTGNGIIIDSRQIHIVKTKKSINVDGISSNAFSYFTLKHETEELAWNTFEAIENLLADNDLRGLEIAGVTIRKLIGE